MKFTTTLQNELTVFNADINECILHTDNCSIYANCSNTIGSYDCTCNAGFTGDGYTCQGTFILFVECKWLIIVIQTLMSAPCTLTIVALMQHVKIQMEVMTALAIVVLQEMGLPAKVC